MEAKNVTVHDRQAQLRRDFDFFGGYANKALHYPCLFSQSLIFRKWLSALPVTFLWPKADIYIR